MIQNWLLTLDSVQSFCQSFLVFFKNYQTPNYRMMSSYNVLKMIRRLSAYLVEILKVQKYLNCSAKLIKMAFRLTPLPPLAPILLNCQQLQNRLVSVKFSLSTNFLIRNFFVNYSIIWQCINTCLECLRRFWTTCRKMVRFKTKFIFPACLNHVSIIA